jgi:membrane associated rhomboid family serine protease
MNNNFSNPLANIPIVVKNLLIINVLMLFITWVLKNTYHIELNEYLGLYYFKSEHFHPYQYVTHMFMHGGISHLFFNMFALWMFGRVLETVWGAKRFFIYYMVVGLGAAAFYTLVNYIHMSSMMNAVNHFMASPNPDDYAILVKKYFPEYYNQVYVNLLEPWFANPSGKAFVQLAADSWTQLMQFRYIDVPTVGASGAVFGVLLAFGMLFPNTQLMLLFPPIPIKAKYFVIGYGALELYLGLTQPGSNVAHFAHLGGMIFGFFMVRYWNRSKTHFY